MPPGQNFETLPSGGATDTSKGPWRTRGGLSRIGPALRRAFNLRPNHLAGVIPQQVAQTLYVAIDRLQNKTVPYATLVGLGLSSDVPDELSEELDLRLVWLAEQMQRNPRTARRWADLACDEPMNSPKRSIGSARGRRMVRPCRPARPAT